MARHTDTLPLTELMRDCRKLLTPAGKIALILPYDQRETALNIAREHLLFLSKEVEILPIENAKPKRWLVELSILPVTTPLQSQLTLEKERHQYTEEFTALVKNFYLKM